MHGFKWPDPILNLSIDETSTGGVKKNGLDFWSPDIAIGRKFHFSLDYGTRLRGASDIF